MHDPASPENALEPPSVFSDTASVEEQISLGPESAANDDFSDDISGEKDAQALAESVNDQRRDRGDLASSMDEEEAMETHEFNDVVTRSNSNGDTRKRRSSSRRVAKIDARCTSQALLSRPFYRLKLLTFEKDSIKRSALALDETGDAPVNVDRKRRRMSESGVRHALIIRNAFIFV